MATYYLYRKADHYILPLGETSFNKFHAEDGWIIFNAMVDNDDPTLNNYVVRRSDSKDDLTFDDFLDEIEKYEIVLDIY
jgi:hypothetical protein